MMKLQEPLGPQQAPPEPAVPLAGLPTDAMFERVEFVAGEPPAGKFLLEFSHPRPCRAILATPASHPDHSPASETVQELELLLVPSSDHEPPDLLASVWNWVEPGVPADRRQGHLITLQGARVLWSPGRAGIIAPADRFGTLRLAVVEFAHYEGELRQLELALAKDWPQLEADTPLAFHFDDQAARRSEQLGERFERVVGIRSRLERMTPAVHRPPLHPPTLASQLGERLKERTRLEERMEFLSDQLEVFENVYEMCAERSSQFSLSRKSNTLEWVIIVLLAVECILLLVEIMSRQAT